VQIRNSFLTSLLLGCISLVCAGQTTTTYGILTVAGTNSVGDQGPAIAALFGQTEGIAVDTKGNIYIADAGNNRVRAIAPNGTITTIAGTGVNGFSGDGGPANQAQLNQPYGLALDTSGNLYIADLGNARIREVTANGNIETVAGGGSIPAIKAVGSSATTAQFTAPRNVAVDSNGTIYISDFGGNVVYSVSTTGVLSVFAGNGTAGYLGDGGVATSAELNAPAGLAAAYDGSIYIADSGNNCIRRVYQAAISTVFNTTVPTGIAVSGGALYVAGSNYAGTIYTPFTGVPSALDVATDPNGNVYATTGQFVLEISMTGAVSTVAGSGLSLYFGGDNGPASAARFHTPLGIASDALGNKYIADTANHRIRQIAPDGTINTIAGSGVAGNSGDGSAAVAATLNSPESVAIDSQNNIYVADTGNNSVRKITPDGNIATVLSGLNAPEYVAVDQAGSLYIADTGNDRVLEVTSSGSMNVLAQALQPAAVMVDAKGNVWVSEATRISQVTASGNVTAAVDNLKAPRGLAFLPNGLLAIAETGTNLIRSWSSSGGLVTIAGTGAAGYSGDGGPAANAQLNSPSDLVVDSNGTIWIADTGNNCVRIMTASTVTAVPPAEQVTGVTIVNAASLASGGVAAGEIITIFGSGFDPNETQLLFDGKAATTLYVGANQINAITPADLSAGSTTQITISVDGAVVDALPANVVAASPGIFTVSGGAGQAAALNQDGSVNSSTNPASRGAVIVLFATGQGLDLSAVSVTIGGYAAGLIYAGPAPGYPGLMQINAQIPGGFLAPGVQPVILNVGNASSQNGVTISVE